MLRTLAGRRPTVIAAVLELLFVIRQGGVNPLRQSPVFVHRRGDPHRQVAAVLQLRHRRIHIIKPTVGGRVAHIPGKWNPLLQGRPHGVEYRARNVRVANNVVRRPNELGAAIVRQVDEHIIGLLDHAAGIRGGEKHLVGLHLPARRHPRHAAVINVGVRGWGGLVVNGDRGVHRHHRGIRHGRHLRLRRLGRWLGRPLAGGKLRGEEIHQLRVGALQIGGQKVTDGGN